ncbi:frizzled-4 [Ceratitis capitata]|uniref:Frizzled-4 n=1 Tax=Ceratitis capitata TaxID=7213 RepID=W8BG70_CERCA|nr:frizzled-4 [Ceratitis capitata]XP_012162965.1 frizzled-4 [Ceratitis capitata]XP_012162966.1 frizzled-4 [Ceratitis capitata]
MGSEVCYWKMLLISSVVVYSSNGESSPLRHCESIRIDMCRGIGYNETSMPNLVGHELQSDVEYTLQTFAPLIEYVCSTQLKLFLCAAYVPLCTPKVPVPIGPCRSLCESVRMRCHPVLQGFGFPWPPALDCNRFPKENNHETMCIEGPGETQSNMEHENFGGATINKVPSITTTLECPGLSKSHMYVKLHRSGRCAPLCEADILFGQHEKHLAELWVAAWTYADIFLALIAILSLVLSDNSKRNNNQKLARVLTPFVWCNFMVALGWTIRFIVGRTATSCGYDPQLPNVLLLIVDGLSNAACATTFLLRYYFFMASCAWWAILCLTWHRDVRRIDPEDLECFSTESSTTFTNLNNSTARRGHLTNNNKRDENLSIMQSNLASFMAWGLPAFQTAAVIVARLVDADELIGSCFVGNQSDKGLQILVATPLFCYWIFGSMNLGSGYLVYRRYKAILKSTSSPMMKQHFRTKCPSYDFGTFLFIYCVPCALLLISVIYEFANIDIWLNIPPYLVATEGFTTPMWPFLTRAFMEILLGIICFAWLLGPKISMMYKQQLVLRNVKETTVSQGNNRNKSLNCNYSTTSYQTVRAPASSYSQRRASGSISMNQLTKYSHNKVIAQNIQNQKHLHKNRYYIRPQQTYFECCGDETIL